MTGNSLYFIRPDWQGDRDDAHEAVVKTFYGHGPRDISVGIELWRLAGNENGARELERLLERAFDRDDVFLDHVDMTEMIGNIERLQKEVEKNIIDSEGAVPDNKLPDIQARADLVDVDEERGDQARYGVMEALSKVVALRDLLREALEQGLHVALDYS